MRKEVISYESSSVANDSGIILSESKDRYFSAKESTRHGFYSEFHKAIEREDEFLRDYSKLEEFHENVRKKFDVTENVMLGIDLINGIGFPVDLPVYSDEEMFQTYVPLSSSDTYLCNVYDETLYKGYLAKIYFWEHLADKKIWERDSVSGKIYRKKKTFYARDISERITPVIIEDRDGSLMEDVIEKLRDENTDLVLICANEHAALFNKFDPSKEKSRFYLR